MYQEEEVKAGIALLDEKKPGWRARFSGLTLDMNDIYHCVLGQVYGNFYEGLRELGLVVAEGWFEADQPAVQHGFQSPDTAYRYTYSDLGDTWKALVRPATV